ncbi:protocadherin-20-like [Astyanax mexicanus]|uniref:Protocadherin 20 n=1 Tax=Astyanax mexicanus TaxID=7994 RepID=A0A8B9LMK4_ASTMX|nr:protocadherin-20-like [Astyanax mexicanus]
MFLPLKLSSDGAPAAGGGGGGGGGGAARREWVQDLGNMNLACLLQRVLLVASVRQIICHSLPFSTPEEQVEGIKIGSLSGEYSPPYQLLGGGYLRVDEETGDLFTTVKKIDREALCPSQEEDRDCTISDDALVGPDQEVVKITVVVEDINDNAPYFETDEIHLKIPEDAAVGTRLLLDDEARDDDVGSNGEISYHLEEAEGVLLSFFSVALDRSALELVVEKELDREAQDEHRLLLVAVDGGVSPSLSSTVSLIVSVLDVNDHCPQFSSDHPQTATVPAGASRGTAVCQVQATDRDLGPNAQISYSFNPQVSEKARALFRLDRVTGEISLAVDVKKLQSSEEHVLKVVAESPHCPAALTQVIVYLQPVANLEPSIEIKFVAEYKNQTIVLRENEPPTVLALLELRDTSSIQAVLSLEADSVPFTLKEQGGNYLLSTSKPLDFELCSDYRVTVVISEAQGKHIRGRKVIKVAVEDVNDNAPQFQQLHYQAEIEENNKPGVSLIQVRATDADSRLNGEVSYRLIQSPHLFNIDEATGVLSASKPLDRERQSAYVLTVLAKDQGSPSLEALVSVSVNVLDLNDNQPTFLNPHFVFFVSESIPLLAQVGKIGVMDADDGENGKVVDVRVLNKNVPFAADVSQLSLRCTAEVDREKQDRYEFLLLATDGGSPPRSSTTSVTVFVEDVNDNCPQVILPSSNLSCFTVSPSTSAGSTITKIYAVDSDSGMNSDITYQIVGRQPAWPRLFEIDRRSGNITLVGRLAGSDEGMHHLFIVVSDGGKPAPLNTTVWINLLVNETLEQCHITNIPQYLSQTSEAPVQPPQEPVNEPVQQCTEPPWFILLCGLGMMVFSVCMFLAATAICLRQKQLMQQRTNSRENHELKLLS